VSISPLRNEGRMVLAEGLADESEAANNCSGRFSVGGGGDNSDTVGAAVFCFESLLFLVLFDVGDNKGFSVLVAC
ncbi:hypothetical protein Q6314_27510, partial [Klebsiella pneumoniae]